MNIRPLHDRAIIKRKEEERTSPGGIVIPDTALKNPSAALLQQAKAKAPTAATYALSTSKLATTCCLANTAAPK